MGHRVLITSWDGGGNTTPAFHLAIRLRRRGHEVLLMGWPSMAGRAELFAIPFTTYSRLDPWPDGIPLEHDQFALLRRMVNGREAEADIVDVATAYRPDVLIIDCMMAAAFRAGAALGAATSVICHVLYIPYYDTWADQALQGDVTTLFGGADQILITVVPGLEAARSLPASTSYVGPICHPDPGDPGILDTWDLATLAESGHPWVLMSLSSTPMGQEQAIGPLLAAVEALPVRVLLTLGGVMSPEDIAAPVNVTVRGYVPHDFLVPFLDLVVCHGGLTTVNTALVAGKPLVCIPQGRDQMFNGTRVEESGVGRMLSKDANPADIAAAIDQVLTDPSFRSAAEGIARDSAPLGRGERAVDLIEALVVKGRL